MSVHSQKKIFCGNFDFFLELLVNRFFVLFQSNPVGRKQIFVDDERSAGCHHFFTKG